MQRMFVRVVAVGGLALMYGSSLATAEAVSSPIGELVDATKADSTIVHMIKSGHGGGHSSGYSSGPHASSPMAFGAAASMGEPTPPSSSSRSGFRRFRILPVLRL